MWFLVAAGSNVPRETLAPFLFHVKHRTYVRLVFHVKPLPHNAGHPYHLRVTLRRSAVLALALLLLPALSSCVRVLNPSGWAPVAFDGDTAYVATSKGHISAISINGDSGTAKWTFPDKNQQADKKFDTKALYGAPVFDDTHLYLTSFAGGVFALNKADGRPVWPGPDGNASKIDGNVPGGIALADRKLFFGTTNGRVYGWNAADASAAVGWESPKKLNGGVWATPIVDGDTLFVATMKGELHAFSLTDGSERWTPFKASGAIADLALVNKDLLFVPSINHHAYLVRTSDGSVAADFKAGDWVWTSPAVQDGKVFFGDFSGNVYGVDISSGQVQQLWDAADVNGERVKAGPAIVQNVLVVADRKPVVTFISAADGSILNRVPIPNAGTVRANVVANGNNAFVVTTDGHLFRAEPENRRVVEIVLNGVKK
jgi:outer membrane protein assembly factor BamB